MKLCNFITVTLFSGITLLPSNTICAQQVQVTGNFNNFPENKVTNLVRATDNPKQLPLTENIYSWENEDWVIKNLLTTVYNDSFQRTDFYRHNYYDGYISESYHYQYVYDDEGRVSSFTQMVRYPGEEYINEFRYVLGYDDVCKYYNTFKKVEEWDIYIDEWMPVTSEEGFYTEIERDAANRVVSKITWASERKDLPLEGLFYKYDSDNGPATAVTLKYPSEEYKLIPFYYYDELSWVKSDCQYINESSNINYKFGSDPNNVIKSYKIYKYDKKGIKTLESSINYIFDEDGRKESVTILGNDGNNILNTYKYESNGDYTYNFSSWEDKNKNGIYDDGEAVYNTSSVRTIHKFDNYGNKVSETSLGYNSESKDFDVKESEITNEYAYLEDGTMTENIRTVTTKGNEQKKTRHTYEDFVEYIPSSINNLEEESITLHEGYVSAVNGSRYMIFDVQGRKCADGTVTSSKISLDNLSEGLYLLKVNNKSFKIVKK